MALTLAVSLSFPICNMGVSWGKDFMWLCLLCGVWLDDRLTSVICGEHGGIHDDHIVI